MAGEQVWQPSADRAALLARARLRAAIRAFMAERGVLEVDTPLISQAAPSERGLQSFAIAEAGYLIPSPEHGLKRLLAAGAGALYQLGPVFRAGECGRWHNPEFCMLEWYRPESGMQDAIDETAALIASVAGAPTPAQTTFCALFAEHLNLDPLVADSATLARVAESHAVAPAGRSDDEDRAFWLDLLMSLVIQPRLGHERPLCVTGFPADDAVLVAPDEYDPRLSQRFELYWHGIELANGACELQDAALAERRMQRETAARARAGEPAPPIDHALLAAMAAGLPACAGVALGVDRLLALMLGRDGLFPVLPFAWMRR